MSQVCNKTQLSKARAFYVLGQLIIIAEGSKPTPCHQARVEYWPFRIYPPQYQVVACVHEGVICMQQIMSYTEVGIFSVSEETLEAMGGNAVVHHRDGAEKVPVKVIQLPAGLTADAAAVRAREGGMPYPFSVSRLIETGSADQIEILSGVKLHTATGYSNSFSFTEAFEDAIGNLPPDQNPHPDKLVNVSVTRTGAEFGGIAGLHRMYVKVASFY